MDSKGLSSSSAVAARKTMLQLMFEAEDTEATDKSKRLSHEELRDELKTFMYVGHDTTSVLCHWALYCFGKYPEIQQKVYEDVSSHTKDNADIDLDSVEKMTYFRAFLNEVLRFYPPVGYLAKFLSKDVSWKGYHLPADTRALIPIFLLHRHPDHWVRPLEFWPERWLDEKATKARHPFAFIPFSAGGRNCIGQAFALTEAKIILTLIVRNFHVTLPRHLREKELKLTNFATLKSSPSVEICVVPRASSLC